MAKKQTPTFRYVTAFGTAGYKTCITEPDVEGQFADNKFKVPLIFKDEDHKAIVEALRAQAIKWHGAENGADATLPIKEFVDREAKKEGKKVVTDVGINFKSQFRPAVFDAKKQKLPAKASVGAGSVLRIESFFFPWSKTTKMKVKGADGKSTMEDVTEYGVSIRLGDVQVRELVESGAAGSGNAFDEVEGFEYDGDGDTSGDNTSFDAL